MPGQKGNKNSANGKEIRDAIRHEIARIGREIEGDEPALKKGMRKIAAPLVANAIEGNPQAFREIADRVDGKAPQAVEVEANVGLVSGTVTFRGMDDPDPTED